MFKELGAFIDEVGRVTGRVFKEMLSDKEDDDELMGDIVPDIDEMIHSRKHIIVTIKKNDDTDNLTITDVHIEE